MFLNFSMIMAFSKRFYVGNLFAEVQEADLEKLFGKFGHVDKVEIKTKTDVDGKVMTTFAFVTVSEMASEDEVARCIKEYNNLKWKKQVIKVQQAQESFLNRLQKEREEAIKANFEKAKDYNPLALVKKAAEQTNKRFYRDSSDEEEETVKRPALKPTFGQNNKPPQINKFSMEAIKSGKSSKKADEKASVSFLDEDKATDDQESGGNKLEFEQKRKRVYHSSSEDEDFEEHKRSKKALMAKKSSDVLAQLESFNSDFWNDEGGFGKPNKKVTLEGPFGQKKSEVDEVKPTAIQEEPTFVNKSIFSQEKSSGFSLLSKFSGEPLIEEAAKKEEPFVDSFALKLKEKVATESAGGKVEPFFFKPDDPRLLSECALFLTLKQKSFSELRTKYEETRPVLASIMKKKLKNRAKKQEKMSFGTKSKRKFSGHSKKFKKVK